MVKADSIIISLVALTRRPVAGMVLRQRWWVFSGTQGPDICYNYGSMTVPMFLDESSKSIPFLLKYKKEKGIIFPDN